MIDKREICGLTIFHLKNNLIRCLKSFYNLINLKKKPRIISQILPIYMFYHPIIFELHEFSTW